MLAFLEHLLCPKHLLRFYLYHMLQKYLTHGQTQEISYKYSITAILQIKRRKNRLKLRVEITDTKSPTKLKNWALIISSSFNKYLILPLNMCFNNLLNTKICIYYFTMMKIDHCVILVGHVTYPSVTQVPSYKVLIILSTFTTSLNIHNNSLWQISRLLYHLLMVSLEKTFCVSYPPLFHETNINILHRTVVEIQ